MSWILDEPRRMLRDSARDYIGENAPVAQLRELRDKADARGCSAALWQGFGAQGYAATLVPEAHGGLGLGVCEAAIVAEQIGRTLAAVPFLSTAVLAAWPLRRGASAVQQAAWLPRIAAAGTVLALAVDERARHAPDAIETRAERTGAGFELHGEKVFVVDGHVAEAFVVAARADADVALFLVPAAAAGVGVERTVMVDAHNAARVRFDGVALGAEAMIGSLGDGPDLLDGTLDAGRVVVAAELQGLADEAYERTLEYLKERRQFDRAIGEFQALQHRAAELFCDLELSRALVRQAAQAFDDGDAEAPRLVAQAKARACLSANRAVQEAVQMHGGIGMTDELEIGFFMKRARVLQELLGDAAFHIDRAARLGGY